MHSSNYPPETIGSRMSTRLPACKPGDTYEAILASLSADGWQSTRNVYVLDPHHRLIGYIDVGDLMRAKPGTKASELMQEAAVTLHPHADQEKAIFLAAKNDVVTIPVVEHDGHFLGTITAHTIIDIMHEEHMEDALMSAGIRGKGSDIIKLASSRARNVFAIRAPWLVLGMVFGLSLGFIASLFEETLSEAIALAYFIPVVAYIADSVGTQSGAIAVRALATLKLSYLRYASKELVVGVLLGIMLGVLGGLGALLISREPDVAVAVGIALFAASTVAATLASLIPFLFKKLGKDPALGSGPLATALQDVISVLIYFLVAVAIVGV